MILVSGAGGFVGEHLCRKLLEMKFQVRAMIRRKSDLAIPSSLQELKKIYGSSLEIIRGDVTDIQDIYHACMGVDKVYHLASQSFVPDSVKNPRYTTWVNTQGIMNLLSIENTPRILYVSSSEVYGNVENLPIDEDTPTNPLSPYAASKLYGEHLCNAYVRDYEQDVVITRAFNHEGVGRGHHFVTASIVRQAVMCKKEELDKIVIGDPYTCRDWSHVIDIVEGYIQVMEQAESGTTWVLGSDTMHSILDFAGMVKKMLSLEAPIYSIPELKRTSDVKKLQADSRKIRRLGWKPKYNIFDVIQEMIAYYLGMSKSQRASLQEQLVPILTEDMKYIPTVDYHKEKVKLQFEEKDSNA